ncbi:MAG: CaiB/BaiF CoA transferase family protein [Alphaproteobacteria bacterium]
MTKVRKDARPAPGRRRKAAAAAGSVGILAGVRVLDLTRFLSGPQATLFLAALGAEVIRIDDPAVGDPAAAAPPFFGAGGVSFERSSAEDLGMAYLKRARAKKAITLNLKSAEGRALFFRLVEQADVLVENFRVGVSERLGIGYGELKERNRRIIHCAITGYGSSGPDRGLKAYDLMVQAATGLMSITGEPGSAPCKAGTPLSDGIAGTFALAGILGALFRRESTGEGQAIDVAMADCLVSLMFDEPLDCYERLGLPLRQGNRIMRFSPFNSYATRDGAVVIGAATGADWTALLEEMARTDLLASEDFMSTSWRLANNDAVDRVVAAWTRPLASAEVLARLTRRDIACSPIREVGDVVSWPHLNARGMLEELVHPALPAARGALAPGFPLKFSGSHAGYDRPAPLHAQHNEEIYGELLGLTRDDLAALKEKGVV